jgi:hypothetical protein
VQKLTLTKKRQENFRKTKLILRFLPDYGLFNQRPRRTQKIPEKDHFCRGEDDCLFLRRISWVLRHIASTSSAGVHTWAD